MFGYIFFIFLMFGISAWWGYTPQDLGLESAQTTVEEEVVNPLPGTGTTSRPMCCDIGAPPPMF